MRAICTQTTLGRDCDGSCKVDAIRSVLILNFPYIIVIIIII